MSEELDARAPYLLKRSLSTARMAHTMTSMTFYESVHDVFTASASRDGEPHGGAHATAGAQVPNNDAAGLSAPLPAESDRRGCHHDSPLNNPNQLGDHQD